MTFAHHAERSATVCATPADVFEFLDNHRKLSGHMASRSAMLLGSSMEVETDEWAGRGVGAPIRLRGRGMETVQQRTVANGSASRCVTIN